LITILTESVTNAIYTHSQALQRPYTMISLNFQVNLSCRT